MDDFSRLALDLAQMPSKVVRQGRGATAPVLDGAAKQAQQRAVTLWTRSGRGTGESAATIRARMAADRGALAGYLLADGAGAFFQENGAGHNPPQPVLRPAAEQAFPSFADRIGEVVEQAFR